MYEILLMQGKCSFEFDNYICIGNYAKGMTYVM